ncbi:uncharacterized protein LOC141711742 [Apium graveolens]|uniref:uncharacterized protein LOC141711742 n=1 Tax=Apium graveolens TaxID=4045 RepID=UPI003D790CF4
MYPICNAVVEVESTDSWRWFTDLMREDLDLGNGNGITIISDQQKGLENAIKELLPKAEHRFCTRHIYSNLRKKFPSTLLKKQFWIAACSTHSVAHTNAMKQILNICKPAHEHLKKINPAIWSKAFISTTPKADNIENNMSECYNSWIINERYLPLLTILQEMHFKLMARVKEKRDETKSSNMVLCPRIKKLLDVAVKNSREWRASWDGDNKYLVKSGTKDVTVDLSRRSCDCRVFDIKCIPCPHVVDAIHDSRQQPTYFVSDYYKRDMYLASYNFSIEAVKGEEYWNYYSEEPLLPPELPKKLWGRPKRLRRREEWESGSARRGHRKNKCPTISAGANAGIGGENTHGQNHATQGQMDENVQGQAAGNSKVGITRPKLVVRRSKTKGLPIDEGPVITTQVSQTNSSLNEDMMVKNNETPASSKSSHFMYQVLGKVGYEALYKPM